MEVTRQALGDGGDLKIKQLRARQLLRGEPTTLIISIAQHARPNVSGHGALARAQFCAFSSVVSPTRPWT